MAVIRWDPRLSYYFGSGGPDDNGIIYTLTGNEMRGGPEYEGLNLNSDLTWTAGFGDKAKPFDEVTVTEDGRMFGIVRDPEFSDTGEQNPSPKIYEIVNDDVTGISVEKLQFAGLPDNIAQNQYGFTVAASPDGSLYVSQWFDQEHEWKGEHYISEDPGMMKLTENDDGTWSGQEVQIPDGVYVLIQDMQFVSATQFFMIEEEDPGGSSSVLRFGTFDENGSLVSLEVVDADLYSATSLTIDQDADGNIVIHTFEPDYVVKHYERNGEQFDYREYDETISSYRVTDWTLENARFVDGKLSWDSVTEGETRIQESYQDRDGSGPEYNFDGGASNGSFAPICFASGTLIETVSGPVAVENLHQGMMLRTLDSGFQPIRWIGSRVFSEAQLRNRQNLRPICIKAGALGHNKPKQDVKVSPQHRILVRSKIAQRMFDTDEVLVAAKQLLEIDGIDIVDDGNGVEYFHFMFDQHEIVFANGTEAESLFTGAEALKSVGEAAREEIFNICPQLRDGISWPPIRPLVTGKLGRKLAARHRKNDAPLVKCDNKDSRGPLL